MCSLVVVAPDKFKHTMTAAEAADVIAGAVRQHLPDACVRCCPMADGGEETSAILGRLSGYETVSVDGYDCLMNKISVRCQIAPDGSEAIVDSSAVIGLQMIDSHLRDPWRASSWPLGDIVRKLADRVAGHVTVAVGGTATVDCGLGFLQALGCQIHTASGVMDHRFRACDLLSVTHIVLPGSFPALKAISDVDVPLLDGDGHVSMLSFAAQKGVADDELIVLKKGVDNIVENVRWTGRRPDFRCHFGGAGGGLGFALRGVVGCDVVGGAEAIAGRYHIFDGEKAPSLVITGEGSYDRQSVHGKVTGTLQRMCREHSVRCVVIAGRVEPGLESDDVISTVVPDVLDHDSAVEALRCAADRWLDYLSRSIM